MARRSDGPRDRAIDLLNGVKGAIEGDRSRTHGSVFEHHERIGLLWTAYLEAKYNRGVNLEAEDVAHMMTLLKIARSTVGEFNPDDYVDAVGYAVLAYGMRAELDITSED